MKHETDKIPCEEERQILLSFLSESNSKGVDESLLNLIASTQDIQDNYLHNKTL